MQRFAYTTELSTAALDAFDAIIDVRSPSEFAEDHLPGAINLPVLDDSERARVGTHYTQVSAFEARRMGAARVSRNIARHLETRLADRPKAFRPLVYCWRGGMRSQSMAMVLASVGWRVTLVEGGYRTWRRQVVAALDSLAPARPVVIDGQTGTGKTALLHALADAGEQVIDLEGLARHRGSIFGDLAAAPQPGQKAFETGLHCALRDLDPGRPVFIEAESKHVGKRRLPPALWQAMQDAPRIRVRAPVPARARFLVETYADLMTDPARLTAAIDGLRPLHPRSRIDGWQDLAGSGQWLALAETLIRDHYDPAYDRARKRQPARPGEGEIVLETLDETALRAAATRLTAMAADL